jgi:sarcosine oxidase subunit beta
MLYNVAWYRRLGVEIGEPVIVQNGYLFLNEPGADLDPVRQRVAMQQGVGLDDVCFLDRADLCLRFPWLEREAVSAGTFCPSDGFLHPHLIYNEGARLAREAGVRLVQGAPVESATHGADGLASLVTPKGAFSADLYIDCTNAWARRLGAQIGAEELPVDPLKRYLWFVQRDGVMTPDQLASMPLTVCPSGIYIRPENPNTLMMGKKHDTTSEVDFTYEDQDTIEADYSHNSGIDAVPFDLWMDVADVIPPVGEFGGIAATTSGYYGVTPDHNPFLGFDRQQPNLIRLVGFSGHGAMFGPFSAAVAVALAEAGQDLPSIEVGGREVPLDAFQLGRAFSSHEKMVI